MKAWSREIHQTENSYLYQKIPISDSYHVECEENLWGILN